MREEPRMKARLRCGVLVASLVCTTGCLVGPDYETPATDVNPSWLQTDDPRVKPEPVDAVDWWKTFDDPVLDALVEDAYAQNLDLRQAAVRVVQAMAERGIAFGELFPQTQVIGGAFDRTKESENPGGGPRYENTWSLGFDAAWELDLWGRFRRNLESADAVLAASFASYDDVMVSLVAEVAATYVALRQAQVRIAIAEENVEIQEKSLGLAEARFRLGQTSELDVAEAKSQLARTKAQVPALDAQLKQAMYQLGFLLGAPPRDLAERVGLSGEIPLAPAEVAVGVPADLLRRRPDIRLAERQAAARSAQIGLAEADLYPAFSLSGSLGFASDESDSLLESDSWTGSITPGFSWPVLNYGRIENNVRVQDALFQTAILDFQSSVLSAAQEVESALASFLGAQEQVRHLADSVTAAKRSLELSTIQYTEGSSTFTRVLDAQTSLREAEETLADAQAQVAQSLIATYKALGGGWETTGTRELLPEETRREMQERTDWGSLLEPQAAADDGSFGDDTSPAEDAAAPVETPEPTEPPGSQGPQAPDETGKD